MTPTRALIQVGDTVRWKSRLGGVKTGVVLYFETIYARVRVRGKKGWTKTAYHWKLITDLDKAND